MENKILLGICVTLIGYIFYNSFSNKSCSENVPEVNYHQQDSIINCLNAELDSIKSTRDSIYVKIDSIFKSIDDIEIKVDTKSKKEALEWIKYYNSQLD